MTELLLSLENDTFSLTSIGFLSKNGRIMLPWDPGAPLLMVKISEMEPFSKKSGNSVTSEVTVA